MQSILKQVERADLLLALKGATPEMQALVLRNMSNRAGADVRDELEIMGPTPRSMVTRAQENIVEIALRLADEQVIFLPLGGGDELI
jgi:flagellar motor switch protein FliG